MWRLCFDFRYGRPQYSQFHNHFLYFPILCPPWFVSQTCSSRHTGSQTVDKSPLKLYISLEAINSTWSANACYANIHVLKLSRYVFLLWWFWHAVETGLLSPTLQLHSCLLLLRKISEILFEGCYSTFLAANFRLLQSLVILLIEYCSLLAEQMCSCPTVSKRGPPIAINLAVAAYFSCKTPLFPGHVTWSKAVIFPGTETWLFLYCNICHCVRLFLHIFYSCWQRVPRQIFFYLFLYVSLNFQGLLPHSNICC